MKIISLFSTKETAFICAFCLVFCFLSCKNKNTESKEEQITVISEPTNNTDSVANNNSIQGNISFNQIATTPNNSIVGVCASEPYAAFIIQN